MPMDIDMSQEALKIELAKELLIPRKSVVIIKIKKT